MTTLVAVPQGGDELDVLAARYRVAFAKTNAGREQWIEGILELAVVVAVVRKKLPDHRAFSRWLHSHSLEQLHPNDFWALSNFAKDLVDARKMLEQSNSRSVRGIWEKARKDPRRTLLNSEKGARTPISRRSGASQRKRAQRIPTAMRDDPPGPPPQRKAIVLKGLTREQVDPDFKGTAVEFAAKYGPVNLHTKTQIEDTKRQEVLAAWLGTVADLDRASRAMLTALAAVNPATLQEWTRRPLKAEKMRAWCDSIQVACEAIRKLCPPPTRE